MASQPTATEASRPTRSVSNAGQACRECKRRKGRCDGALPVCSVCQRYNRHCLYDKHSRSALTRRHLTEVEEKLERAEGLLRRLVPEQQLQQLLSYGLTDPLFPILQGQPQSLNRQNSGPTQPSKLESLSPSSGDVEREGFDKQAPRSAFTQEASHEFETVPFAADDDFEWDERESLWTLGDPGGRSTNFDVDAEIPKLTDGMATLTANDTNTGFLGSVSGASLLRLISSGSNGNPSQPSWMKHEQRDESMPDARHPNYSSPGPALRAQPLLTRQFFDGLIDAYFCHYHPTFPILHELTFREQYQNLGNRPKGTWHVLANLVAAMGSFVSSPCNDDTHITLFNAVKNSLSIESIEAGSLGLVQVFAMAANYLQKRNRPNSGYNYGGLALRLAISLGLHKEVHGWQTTPLKKEIRRRVWWSLCVLDVGATVTYGRPLNWPRVGPDTPFPLNIEEASLTADSTSLPAEISEATYYSYINTQSSYHLRTMRIYDRLISGPVPTADELIHLDDDCIEGWRKSLPAYYCDEDLHMKPENFLGHSMGRWRYRVMRVVMYRPFLLRWAQNGFPSLDKSSATGVPSMFSEAENLATKRCLSAAEECISVLFRFWTTATHTRLAAWYVLYFLLQAALIPIHCLRRNPSHPSAPSWRAQVLTALNVITAMNNINPSAQKCRDIFYRLCGDSLPRQHDDSNSENLNNDTFDDNTFGVSPPDQLHDPQSATSASWGGRFNVRTNSASSKSGHPLSQQQRQHNQAQRPQRPQMPPPSASTDPWMTEIDSAVNGYNMYINRLSSAAATGSSNGMNMQGSERAANNSFGGNMISPTWPASQHQQRQQGGGQGSIGDQDGPDAQGNMYNNPSLGAGVGLGMGMPTTGAWETELDTGAQDWDWGLMLGIGH